MQVALPSLIWKLLLLWLLPIGTGGETGVFVVRSNWASGYAAQIAVILTQSVGANGWTITLTFNKPIKRLDQWIGTTIPASDGRTFRIRNNIYNAVLPAGHKLTHSVIVQKAVLGEAPGYATVLFERNTGGSGGNSSVDGAGSGIGPVTSSPSTAVTGSGPVTSSPSTVVTGSGPATPSSSTTGRSGPPLSLNEGLCRTLNFVLSEKNFALMNHLIKSIAVRDEHDCARSCFATPGCMSINYEYIMTRMKTCELNNSTKEIDYKSFVEKLGFVYFG